MVVFAEFEDRHEIRLVFEKSGDSDHLEFEARVLVREIQLGKFGGGNLALVVGSTEVNTNRTFFTDSNGLF